MPAAAWTIPCAHRLWEVTLQVRAIPNAACPQSNEWDTMLNKNGGYIQNWKWNGFDGDRMFLLAARRTVGRRYGLARYWDYDYATLPTRTSVSAPSLEVPERFDTLGADGLAVTLNLGGGKLGGSSMLFTSS